MQSSNQAPTQQLSGPSHATDWASCKAKTHKRVSDWPLQLLWEVNMTWHYDKVSPMTGWSSVWWFPVVSMLLSGHEACSINDPALQPCYKYHCRDVVWSIVGTLADQMAGNKSYRSELTSILEGLTVQWGARPVTGYSTVSEQKHLLRAFQDEGKEHLPALCWLLGKV